MALNASDIGRLKAAVPTIYRPRDVAGTLADSFDNSASLREREQFNLGMKFVSGDDQSQAPSFILSGSVATVRKAQLDKRNEERRRDERTTVQRALDALNERIAALDAEIATINEDLRRIAERRAAIAEQLTAIDDIEELRRKGIKLDPANPAHAKLLRASGLSASEINGDGYLAALLRKRVELSTEDGSLALDQDSKIKRRDQLTLERTEALGLRSELEGANTDEARILAGRRASTFLGRDQLSTAAYESNSAKVKLVAADAIAGTEGDDRREASTKLTHAAAASDTAAIFKTDTKTFAP